VVASEWGSADVSAPPMCVHLDMGCAFQVVGSGSVHVWGARQGVGGGRHLFGCCYQEWQHCCVAAVEMEMTTTMSSSSSTAHAIFLLVCIISGCLPSSCLSVASTFPSPPLFSSSSPFFLLPTPSFPSPSFKRVSSGYETWCSCSREVDGGGLVGLTDTGWLWWWCGIHWSGTSDPLIHGIRGCGVVRDEVVVVVELNE
jgi:hypothetical protein